MKARAHALNEEKKAVFEMINASRKLAERLGKHPLTRGCNCIACINKRKRILNDSKREWKYWL